jgi:hypothetical protein
VEVLDIQGVEVSRDGFVQLAVFVNLPEADGGTPTGSAEFVGVFNAVPAASGRSRRLATDVRLEIGDNLERVRLQIGDDPEVVITIVVKAGSSNSSSSTGRRNVVTIRGLQIIYQTITAIQIP